MFLEVAEPLHAYLQHPAWHSFAVAWLPTVFGVVD